MHARTYKTSSGFTVAELITVVAIVGILASVVLPVAKFGLRVVVGDQQGLAVRGEGEARHRAVLPWESDQQAPLRVPELHHPICHDR